VAPPREWRMSRRVSWSIPSLPNPGRAMPEVPPRTGGTPYCSQKYGPDAAVSSTSATPSARTPGT
jgi:hypothetical protein